MEKTFCGSKGEEYSGWIVPAAFSALRYVDDSRYSEETEKKRKVEE